MKEMGTKVALRVICNNNEDRFVRFATEGSRKGYLELTTKENLFTSQTAFVIEPAGNGLVHIRCCYNNKYLCRAPIVVTHDENGKIKTTEESDSCMICLGANQVVERSAFDCTLFQIDFHDDNDNDNDIFETPHVVSFTHVRTNYSVMVSLPKDSDPDLDPNTKEEEFSLFMKKCGENEKPFHFSTMPNLMRLPTLVNFIGDNNQYLRGVIAEHRFYNQFSGVDGFSVEAMYETFSQFLDGRIITRVQSKQWKMFWRRSPNWIWSDSTDTSWRTLDSRFEVFNLPIHKRVALRNQGNGAFCTRFTHEGKESMYHAGSSTMSLWSHLKIEEPVLSRTMMNPKYNLHDAKLVELTPLLHGTIDRFNTHYDRDEEEKPFFLIRHTNRKFFQQTTTVSTTLEVSLGVSMSVPFIDPSGSISLSQTTEESMTWGEDIEDSLEFGTESTVIIPPRTKTTIRCYLLRASFDVPFSYEFHDVLATGEKVSRQGFDGLCSGVAGYNYRLVPVHEPLLDS